MGPGGGGDKPVTFAYICTNGTAVDGTTGTEDTEKCSSCEIGFKVHSTTEWCVESVPPAVVTNLAASLPTPLVGTVQLDWTDPTDTDFSHVLISWTPDTPNAPIRVNTGTPTTIIIPATALTVGTAYTFTAVSVDATDNESAASTGTTAVIPLHTPNALFATTVGTTYPPQANVVSGSGTTADPYVIPLVAGVTATTPIVIEFDHSGETIVAIVEHFRITNMPTGAGYTSSTLAWSFKEGADDSTNLAFYRRIDGEIPDITVSVGRIDMAVAKDSMTCGAGGDDSCEMGTRTIHIGAMPTSARTFGFLLFNSTSTDSLTFTLTP